MTFQRSMGGHRWCDEVGGAKYCHYCGDHAPHTIELPAPCGRPAKAVCPADEKWKAEIDEMLIRPKAMSGPFEPSTDYYSNYDG